MSRFVFSITPELEVRLEAFRAQNGFRSKAEALRFIITHADKIVPPRQCEDPPEIFERAR